MPIYTIKCSRPAYRRAGLSFSKGLNTFPAKAVSDEALAIINADPCLEVKSTADEDVTTTSKSSTAKSGKGQAG